MLCNLRLDERGCSGTQTRKGKRARQSKTYKATSVPTQLFNTRGCCDLSPHAAELIRRSARLAGDSFHTGWTSERSSVEGGSDVYDDDSYDNYDHYDDIDRARRRPSHRRQGPRHRHAVDGSGDDIGQGREHHQAASSGGSGGEWRGAQHIPQRRGSAAAATRVRRRGAATAADGGNGGSSTGLAGADGPGNNGGSGGGEDVGGGGGGSGSVGFVDVLRPFYALFKFW